MGIDVYKEWLGIPDGPRPPDHYALLRLVQFEDDADKVRKNYKKLNGHVRKYATGQFAAESQELLNELARAMLCLTDVERKLDYDRSQGREIDDRDPSTGRRPVTAYLIDAGVISQDQAKEIKSFADRSGLSLKDAAIQLKMADQETASRALASELGRAFVDLNEMIPDDTILDILPRQVVRRHSCLPLFEDDDQILVACADDPTHELEDEIRLRYEKPMRPVIATQLGINQGISKYYANGMRNEVAEPTGKKKSKTTSSKTTSAPKAKKSTEKLSDAEYIEQRNTGILIICGTLIAGFNLDTWVLWPYVFQNRLPGWILFPLTFLIAPPVLFFAYMNYIKRK